MSAVDSFTQALTARERQLLAGLTTPPLIQAFLDTVPYSTDTIRRFALLTPAMVDGLAPVDERLYAAGLQGADAAGLFKPSGEGG